jgi:ABC-type transport system involved in multi-copper enzyme maturation permease subunit
MMNRIYLAQLWAITRYEALMHWRRRGLSITMLTTLAVLVVTILISRTQVDMEMVENYQQAATLFIVLITWPPCIVLGFLLPLSLCEAIPLDRQYRVDDLLGSLPLTNLVHLTGKVFGGILAGWFALLISMIVSSVIWWLILGAYDLGIYAEMWLGGAGMLVILNGSLGILAAVGQSTRRRAIGFTLFAGIVFMWFLSLDRSGRLVEYFGIFRPHIINFPNLENSTLDLITGQTWAAFALGLIQLFVVWLAALGWLEWRERRA